MGIPGKELLLDATKGTMLTLALFLAYISFPVLGLLPGIFTALPGIYFYLKRGALAGVTVLAMTVIVLLLMGEVSIPILYLLQSGFIALLLPFFYMQGKGMARSVAYSVGINYLLIATLLIGYGSLAGIDLQDMLVKGIENSTNQAVTLYEKQGVKGEEIKLLTEGIKQAGQLIARLFPALLLVALGVIASLNMTIIFRLSDRLLPNLPKPDDFRNFRNPEMLVWVVIGAGFTVLLPYSEVSRAASNILLVVGFVYFLQGLAVVLTFFQRFAVPGFARILFWLILFFQPYLVLAIAILGIFDIWGDFRTPKHKNL